MEVDNGTTLLPPVRFGHVNTGLYRGGYPTMRNFKFLNHLQLKTIISLTPEAPTADLSTFADITGVALIHVPINRTTNINSTGFIAALLKALSLVLSKDNYPVYVHCLDGRRITGLLVLLLRRLELRSASYAMAEYWKYQLCWRAPPSMAEVEKSCLEIEKAIYSNANTGSLLLGQVGAGGITGSAGPNQGVVGSDASMSGAPPSSTASGTGPAAFDVTLPEGSIPEWLWNGEKLGSLNGWRLLRPQQLMTVPSQQAGQGTAAAQQLNNLEDAVS